MAELEVNLGSFAGRIETTHDFVRFYYEKTL
jgi:toluene monooxygenase system protein D